MDEAGTRAICGLYPENGTELHYLSIAYNTRCIDEVRHSIGVTMNDGSSPDGASFDFVAQRFRPKLINMQIPDSISPELPGDPFASIRVPSQDPGQAHISFRVVDDYDCQRLLGSTEIEISNRVVSGSSGHAHFGTDDQGSGRYIPQNESDQFESGIPYEIAGKTDDQSIFDTLYEAGDLGVTENVRITMIRPPRENEPDEIRVTKNVDLDIKVSGLVRLQPSSVDPFIFAYGGSCPHPAEEGGSPSQQYVTVLAEAQFILIDRIYNELTGNHLSFNDASLPFGGRFENQSGNGRDANCHSSHRRGIDIDVNNAVNAQGLNMEREITYRSVPFTAVDLLTAEVHGRLQVERLPEEPIHYRYMGRQTGGEG